MNDPALCIELAQRLCGQFGFRSMQPQLDACLDLVRNRGDLEVALVGPFNAGKRSFLNFVLGRAVLPVDVLPAAGVATRLRFSSRERAIVHPMEGETAEVPLTRLASFITEQGNPGNERKVASVVVETPAMERWKGLCFVDEPGAWNGTAKDGGPAGRTLVAFPMDHPLGPWTFDLLAGRLRPRPGAVLLLTKADFLEEGGRERVMETLREELCERMGRKIPMMLFSTHEGFGPIQGEVQAHLAELAGDRHSRFIERMDQELQPLLDDVEDYLRLARGAARAEGEAGMDLRRRVQVERIRLGSTRRELEALATQIKARARATAEAHFLPQGPELARRLESVFSREMAGRGGDPAHRSRMVRAWLSDALQQQLDALSESGRQPFEPFMAGAATLAEQSVGAFKERLGAGIHKVLDLPFRGARFQASAASPAAPETLVDLGEEGHLERLGSIIAVEALGPLMERTFLNQIPREVEKNLARLADQWVEAAGAAIDGSIAEAMGHMEGELATIEGTLATAPAREAEIRKAIEELGTARCGLKAES